MIATLRGVLVEKSESGVVLEAGGVGYEVSVTQNALALLPGVGQEAFLHVVESFALYGGGAALYGFSTLAEKSLFLTFRDSVPSTGAKKALEYLEKASKSLPDFRRAVLEKDAAILASVFGFSRKTADKLIAALKDKLDGVVAGPERGYARAASPEPTGAWAQAMSALAALGYKPSEARAALDAVGRENAGQTLNIEGILKLALKRL